MAESESPSPPRGLPRCGTVRIRGGGGAERGGRRAARDRADVPCSERATSPTHQTYRARSK
ncbi:Uncharacterized protein DBV15_04478 [Temnothorax longispinosus]|uniref:Uncharacterized protein n=1 Tax=Temnothorax longispinosus TaxID=300112 RepID=A0A4S2KBL4_9HYME|nr:Uncharacterized protein DBV15_04478 [Temnothorax longispinosus]